MAFKMAVLPEYSSIKFTDQSLKRAKIAVVLNIAKLYFKHGKILSSGQAFNSLLVCVQRPKPDY